MRRMVVARSPQQRWQYSPARSGNVPAGTKPRAARNSSQGDGEVVVARPVGLANAALSRRLISRWDETEQAISAESVHAGLEADALFERLAELAYEESLTAEQQAELRAQGRTVFPPYSPEGDETHFDLQMMGFLPSGGASGMLPILAFRGSQQLLDWVDDLNRSGIGMEQFRGNLRAIAHYIDAMGGTVDVTGHSLGGALAQLTAATFPQKVRRVVTFQAPGIPQTLVDALVRYNASVSGERQVGSTHYEAEGDIVHQAGWGKTPGFVYEIPTELVTPEWLIGVLVGWPVVGRMVHAHRAQILNDLVRLRRDDPAGFRELTITVKRSQRDPTAGEIRVVEVLRQYLGWGVPGW